jgi:vancomycin resistance protein VanW
MADGEKPTLRGAIRGASPPGLRVAVALARRALRDYPLSGTRARLARRQPAPADEPRFGHRVVEIGQVIRKTAFYQGKLANIRLGARLLDGIVLPPGQTLSFWKLVGRPSAAAGFAVGRSIREGAVIGDLGGGLCQLSGIAYEAGLRAGLLPTERHPHSRDLYAEEDRFTPLGLDATVVWPYKDLRLANPFAVPLQFRFEVRDASLSASVHAPVALSPALLEISRVDQADRRHVRVSRLVAGGAPQLISDDVYRA